MRLMLSALSILIAAAALPQTPAPQATQTSPTATAIDGGEPAYLHPETPEQRRERIGMPEDPGPNPDPNKHYIRYGRSYHIERFDRRWASYNDVEPGLVRPFAFVNAQREVYQQNEKYVWVWMPDPTPEELNPPETPTSRYDESQLDYFRSIRPEFTELDPHQSEKVIQFEQSSSGLPTGGSWRNSADVADMNGDGCPDLILPPERKGQGFPAIFLGDCKGHWRFWSEARWPRALDYGGVVAADFNKDGHMDLAFAVHLQGLFVMLGDGKGNFTEASSGLPRDFPTRRVVVADVDHDGFPDLVVLSEGPGLLAKAVSPGGKLRVYLNRDHGRNWVESDVARAENQTAGDWLSIAHLRNARELDMIAATIYTNSNQTIYLEEAPREWKPVSDPAIVPFLSNYYANTSGKFSSKKTDDAIVSYARNWPTDLPDAIVPEPPSKSIVGIDRISFVNGKLTRTPIMRWSGQRGLTGLAAADFDGDGNMDIAFVRSDPRELVILLGDGKGGFKRASVQGVTIRPNISYDLKVTDVNNDGRPDLILMYESTAASALAPQNGSVEVFTNIGVPKK